MPLRAAGQPAPMQYWGTWGGGSYGGEPGSGGGGGFPIAYLRPSAAVAVPYSHGVPPGGYAGPYNCDVRAPPEPPCWDEHPALFLLPAPAMAVACSWGVPPGICAAHDKCSLRALENSLVEASPRQPVH